MSDRQITVYGAFWCPDCHRSKQFLGEHQIPYRWVDSTDEPGRPVPPTHRADGQKETSK